MSDTNYSFMLSVSDAGGGGVEERERKIRDRTISSTTIEIYCRNSSNTCISPSMTYTVKGL